MDRPNTIVTRPSIVGVVNVTEDSFSDGGRFLDPDRAIEHALSLAGAGADVVELGPASSHPDAREVSPDEEIRRLEPVVARLLAAGVPVAIDSFRIETQRYALGRGVAFLNDIQGFPDPEIYPDLARSRCELVVMHSVQGRGRATRVETDPATIVERIERFFTERIASLEAAGVARDRLILDPGMGFFLGNNPEPSLVVLRWIPELKRRFGLPLLVSVSRKSFLRAITGRSVDELLSATLAAEIFAATRGVDY
ncbi:MAG: dihydropteroate synthase, partial [Candidatus Binatia bacterium]